MFTVTAHVTAHILLIKRGLIKNKGIFAKQEPQNKNYEGKRRKTAKRRTRTTTLRN